MYLLRKIDTKSNPAGTVHLPYYINLTQQFQLNAGDAIHNPAHWSTLVGLPLYSNLWKEVHRITSLVTSYNLERSPAQFLLHHSPLSHRTYHKSLAMHIINAAKQCIPIHWKSQNTPLIKEWFGRIKRISEMEELIHIARDSPSKFGIKWACWKHYQTMTEYSLLNSPNH